MLRKLTQDSLFSAIKKVFSKIQDPRKQPKSLCTYTLPGVLGYFFSLFFLHAPSFRSYEEDMCKSATNKARKTIRKLFCTPLKFNNERVRKMKNIREFPCENQTRSIVDRISSEQLRQVFYQLWPLLQRSAVYPKLQTVVGNGLNLGLHVLMDGVETRSSKNIGCSSCCLRKRGEKRQTIEYFHQFLEAVVNVPDRKGQAKHVLVLDVEPIERKDGKDKNGSERNSNKRLIARIAARHKNTKITLSADDIHNDNPTLELLQSKGIHWLMTCKPDSHQCAYDALRGAEKLGYSQAFISAKYVHRIRNQRGGYDAHTCRSHFSWAKVPSRHGDGAVHYTLVEEKIIDINTGDLIITRGFSTDHPVNEKTVFGLRNTWRKLWRLENNGHNDLKNHGANLEHNYGHGKANLTTNTMILSWLSWLVIQILLLVQEDGFYFWRQKYKSLSKAISKLGSVFDWLNVEVISWRDLYEYLAQPPP